MRALVLCAGKGERLRPLTNDVAKPALKLLNVPIWSFPLTLAETLPITSLHVNTHYKPESIQSSFKQFGHFQYPLEFHFEPELLQSAGPLWHLHPSLKKGEDTLIVNGDGVLLARDPKVLQRMMAEHKSSNALATVLCMPLAGVGKEFSGLWVDPGGNIKDIGVNVKDENLKPYHYASFMLVSDRIFDYLPKGPSNIFKDVLLPASQKFERVHAYVSRDMEFFEIGNPEGLSEAQATLTKWLKEQNVSTNLIEVLDRFSPGWRN